jgi:N-acetyl-beta-hexosaminidase
MNIRRVKQSFPRNWIEPGIDMALNEEPQKHDLSIRFNCDSASIVNTPTLAQKKHRRLGNSTERGMRIDFNEQNSKQHG